MDQSTSENKTDAKEKNQLKTFQRVIDAEIKRLDTGVREGNTHVLNQLRQFKKVPDGAPEEIITKMYKVLYESMPKYHQDAS